MKHVRPQMTMVATATIRTIALHPISACAPTMSTHQRKSPARCATTTTTTMNFLCCHIYIHTEILAMFNSGTVLQRHGQPWLVGRYSLRPTSMSSVL
ncbi:hypothetical protein EDB84DRAFT_1470602 [Lactarius hengduanensis]|nr:hypothetical protein EDB84DRAFT_1470602 [Lactarius hengduanensis]